MPIIDIAVAVTLPKLVVEGEAVFSDITGVGAPVLPFLQVFGNLSNEGLSINVTVDVALPLLQVLGAAQVPDVFVTGGIVLSKLRLIGRAQGPPILALLTGQPRASGGTIVVFKGIPYRSVGWEIVSGSGTLVPLSSATDVNGFAYCRYNPGTFVGVVEIGAIYVP